MTFGTSIAFYLLIGASISFAVWLTARNESAGERIFHIATGFLFWPFYLPGLIQAKDGIEWTGLEANTVDRPVPGERNRLFENTPRVLDDMELAITQVENELDVARKSLDGWAEEALAKEDDLFAELRTAWHAQATRIRELDRLLAQPAFGVDAAPAPGIAPVEIPMDDRICVSQRTRHENVTRLRSLRDQMHRDLIGTLAWVRELVTLIHLAKYTGAPASRAEELVAQIAAAVEGLSEVAGWQHPVEWRRRATDELPC